MILLHPPLTTGTPLKHHRTATTTRPKNPKIPLKPFTIITNKQSQKEPPQPTTTSSSPAETLAIVSGLVATPVIGWSLYTLKTTGCGLPPGPGGALGALEGVSYLAVGGIVAWSAYTKSKTGSGLPNGPFGLLGAVEGLSYLALLGIVVVFGLEFLDKGALPGPLPSDQCFG